LIAGFFIADFGLKNGDVMGGEVVESCIFTSGDEFGIVSGMGVLVASLFAAAFDVEVVGAVVGRVSSSCISTSGASSETNCLTAVFPPALERVVGLTFLAATLDFLVDDLEVGGESLFNLCTKSIGSPHDMDNEMRCSSLCCFRQGLQTSSKSRQALVCSQDSFIRLAQLFVAFKTQSFDLLQHFGIS